MTNINTQPITWRNRLASLSFIVLIWLFVRLIAAMDGISWERGFYWVVPLMFGIFPASVGFLIAFFAKNRRDQRWYRCFAWWSIPIAFTSVFLLATTDLTSKTSDQLILPFQATCFILIHII